MVTFLRAMLIAVLVTVALFSVRSTLADEGYGPPPPSSGYGTPPEPPLPLPTPPPPAPAPEQPEDPHAVIVGGPLYSRANPWMGSRGVNWLQDGAPVTITGSVRGEN